MGSLTLPLANTPYNVVALVNAAIQAEGGAAATQTIAGAARLSYVEAHAGIDGVGGNTNSVLIGENIGVNAGNLVTNNRFGRVLTPGAGFTIQSSGDNTDILNWWVQSAGVSQKVNVIIANG